MTALDTLPDGVLLSDGGLATRLEAVGHDLSDHLWSARLLRDDPAAILDAHLAFLRAGAQIVTTASYQASFEGFAEAGIDGSEAERLMRLSVTLARDAVDRHASETGRTAWVAASIGPYGAALADGSEYRGRYGLTVTELRRWHERRLAVLADTLGPAGADLLAIETIPDVDEAAALADLLRGTGHPAWLSYTVEGTATRAGQTLHEAFSLARGIDEIVAVGVNCCDPADVLDAVAAAHGATREAVVVYPNSGEGWDATARRWTGPGRSLTDLAEDWVDAGARIVGGCCRVSPDQITALHGRLRPGRRG